MPLRVTFTLSDKDLRHFRRVMRENRKKAKGMSEEDVISSAETLLREIGETEVSAFVSERMNRLQVMIDMLNDDDWQIPKRERSRVVNALTYFADPDDLIHDDIPVLGLLDDAIMIELVVRELKHEIEAFEEFCAFRLSVKKTPKSELSLEEKQARMAKRRKALHERMRRRSTRRNRATRRRSGPKVSLF